MAARNFSQIPAIHRDIRHESSVEAAFDRRAGVSHWNLRPLEVPRHMVTTCKPPRSPRTPQQRRSPSLGLRPRRPLTARNSSWTPPSRPADVRPPWTSPSPGANRRPATPVRPCHGSWRRRPIPVPAKLPSISADRLGAGRQCGAARHRALRAHLEPGRGRAGVTVSDGTADLLGDHREAQRKEPGGRGLKIGRALGADLFVSPCGRGKQVMAVLTW